MIQIKPISTLLFAVLLTVWVHSTSSQQPPFTQDEEYKQFLERLKDDMNTSGPDDLAFLLKIHVIQDLELVSNEFKELCLHYDFELFDNNAFYPVMALNKAIDKIFRTYMRSARAFEHLREMLKKIKSVDPIGFNIYLTRNKFFEDASSPTFMEFADKFQTNMNQRVRLLNMKTNDSYFTIFDGSSSGTPYNFLPQRIRILPVARDEIATEYAPLSDASIDQFTNLSKQLYRIGTAVNKYRTHYPIDTDDVQILYSNFVGQGNNQEISHAICVWYEGSTKIVRVYDSLMRNKRDDRQEAIIQKLYPFKRSIIHEQPLAVQNRQQLTGAIFAITYASMLLQQKDPAKTLFPLNKVSGDKTVYMRIHILNMLANQKLPL